MATRLRVAVLASVLATALTTGPALADPKCTAFPNLLDDAIDATASVDSGAIVGVQLLNSENLTLASPITPLSASLTVKLTRIDPGDARGTVEFTDTAGDKCEVKVTLLSASGPNHSLCSDDGSTLAVEADGPVPPPALTECGSTELDPADLPPGFTQLDPPETPCRVITVRSDFPLESVWQLIKDSTAPEPNLRLLFSYYDDVVLDDFTPYAELTESLDPLCSDRMISHPQGIGLLPTAIGGPIVRITCGVLGVVDCGNPGAYPDPDFDNDCHPICAGIDLGVGCGGVNVVDCNDRNPDVSPSAPEVCNGMDDNCDTFNELDPPAGVCGDTDPFADSVDCAPFMADSWEVPTEVTNLTVSWDNILVEATLNWDVPDCPGGDPLAYDTLATTSVIPGIAPDFDVCVELNSTSTSSVDQSGPPAPGVVVYYVVRAGNLSGLILPDTCGEGPVGVASDGAPRSASACP